jgi:hypothetical protein
MKTIFTILVILLSIGKAYSTGQIPDYLIQGQDTLPIFNNPLEQYFEQFGNRDLIDFKNPCWSTACWRGYKAYWELKDDSLFLLKITGCHEDCGEVKDANLFAMFGDIRPFASWYNGTLTVPNGELFSGSDMGYNAIYEYEDKLLIENGVLKSKQQISNIDLIKQIKLNNKMYTQISTLKDTLLFYLNKNINWKKIDNTNCDCSDSFILTYDQKGEINKVEFIKYQDESDNIWYRLYEWRIDKKCSRRIKSAIKPLSLAYLNPHRDFKIEIDLFYGDHLEMWECRHYFKPITDKEIEDYVRKQMEIKE